MFDEPGATSSTIQRLHQQLIDEMREYERKLANANYIVTVTKSRIEHDETALYAKAQEIYQNYLSQTSRSVTFTSFGVGMGGYKTPSDISFCTIHIFCNVSIHLGISDLN
ncbi:hypothetical protein [Aquibacillus kalidii]|uniref:hypothetical protein n=1 Tax=Aquibacillus kalidii TaxID=2762597 RepID=UPI001C98F999|nr:hypothetical protein [Aquibacillus kalidii]